MAKCPYCDIPASAWRMWRVTRWSGYRCGGCRRVSRVPGGQITCASLVGFPVFMLPVLFDWLPDDVVLSLGRVGRWSIVMTLAAICACLTAYVMSRKCDLVPPEEARRF
jgi:hypothetical protein